MVISRMGIPYKVAWGIITEGIQRSSKQEFRMIYIDPPYQGHAPCSYR